MTDHHFVHAEILERFTLPGRGFFPAAEIRIGTIGDEWFVGTDYTLSTGEGGGGPVGYWTSWKDRHAHPSRDAALAAGIAELRAKMKDRAEKAKAQLEWLDEIADGLQQPLLFGDAA